MIQSNYFVDKFSIIDNLPLFRGVSLPEKRFIASRIQIVEFKKGETIYEKGDPPGYFYCMVHGRAEIYHPAGKSKKRQDLSIEHLLRGDFFGSISCLTGHPHSVSARTLNDSVLLLIKKQDFNKILHRIPRLAIVLSHSLSRRMTKRPIKKIFESKIISVYGLSGGADSHVYTRNLREAIKKESGKKVLVVKSASIPDKKKVAPILSSFTDSYHYILVDVVRGRDDINFEILKQSDASHIISLSDKKSLRKTADLIKRLEGSFKKRTEESVLAILKEDRSYGKTSYNEKVSILSKEIFASIPEEGFEYRKMIRRIAREISGMRMGLALGSGAAMGLAHIGVLEELEKAKIPIDVISGTSMGALIAAFWAAGFTTKEIKEFAGSFKSKLRSILLMDPTLPVRGLIKGGAVRRVLQSYLGDKTFFDVKLPLRIVACDIKKRKEFVIDKGSLVDAVMASIAIPGVFAPVEHKDGTQLVDGGIVNPVPVSVLSKEGIKRIIAVNTLPSPEDVTRTGKKRLNIYDVIVNSFQATEFTIAENACRQADIYLHPIPKLTEWYEFYRADIFIKKRSHAKKALSKIKSLARI